MMAQTRPDLSVLQRALTRLVEGLARHRATPGDVQLRDGLVQRFEFTYEIAHTTLKRYLEFAAASPGEIDRMTFQDLIRTANEQGVLRGEWPDWQGYRDMRGKTSHTYDEHVALEIVAGIPDFIDEVAILHARLAERLA